MKNMKMVFSVAGLLMTAKGPINLVPTTVPENAPMDEAGINQIMESVLVATLTSHGVSKDDVTSIDITISVNVKAEKPADESGFDLATYNASVPEFGRISQEYFDANKEVILNAYNTFNKKKAA